MNCRRSQNSNSATFQNMINFYLLYYVNSKVNAQETDIPTSGICLFYHSPRLRNDSFTVGLNFHFACEKRITRWHVAIFISCMASFQLIIMTLAATVYVLCYEYLALILQTTPQKWLLFLLSFLTRPSLFFTPLCLCHTQLRQKKKISKLYLIKQ